MKFRINYFATIVVVLWGLAPWSLVSGKDLYVAQNAAGTGSGSDAADAMQLSWVNTASNWGGSGPSILPGDTIHLVGTFTSSLAMQGSGAPGQPITFVFEPGANFTSPCWPTTTGAISLNGQSYINIDGGGTWTGTNGCIPNGIIQNTANGSPPLTISNDSQGLTGQGFFINVKNLTITNIYDRTNPNDTERQGLPLLVWGSDISVSNCNLSDGDGILFYTGPQVTNGVAGNILFVNNKIMNYNHGIAIGEGTQSAGPQNILVTNVVIAGNFFDHSDVWDDSMNIHHMDAIYLVADTYDSTVVLNGMRVCANVFGPHMCNQSLPNTSATAVIGNYYTYPQAQQRNVFVYNNLVMPPVGGVRSWGNAFTASGSNVWFVNNTVAGGVSVGVTGTNAFLYNNLLLGGGTININTSTLNAFSTSQAETNDVVLLSNFFGGVWSDYNVVSPTNEFDGGLSLTRKDGSGAYWVSGIFHPLSAWQTFGSSGDSAQKWAHAHCDAHSLACVPLFSAPYIPSTNDIYAYQRGKNLTQAFSSNNLVAVDFNGVPRPAANWTIGAFEPSPSATVVSKAQSAPPVNSAAPPAPTGLRLTAPKN